MSRDLRRVAPFTNFAQLCSIFHPFDYFVVAPGFPRHLVPPRRPTTERSPARRPGPAARLRSVEPGSCRRGRNGAVGHRHPGCGDRPAASATAFLHRPSARVPHPAGRVRHRQAHLSGGAVRARGHPPVHLLRPSGPAHRTRHHDLLLGRQTRPHHTRGTPSTVMSPDQERRVRAPRQVWIARTHPLETESPTSSRRTAMT